MKAKTRKKKTASKTKTLIPKVKRYVKILSALLAVALVVGLSWQLSKMLRPSTSTASDKKVDWNITAEVSPAEPLPFKNKDLKKEFLKLQSSASSESLYRIAQRLQKKYQAKQVSIVQTAEDHLHVHFYFYQPKMVVKADRLRFLASDGTVFGTAEDEDLNRLPMLEGVFFERSKSIPFRFEAGRLLTNKSEDSILKDSLKILATTKDRLAFKKLTYNKIDGFLIENGLFFNRAYIGSDNFDKKIDNLINILNKIKQKNSYAEKIELDYSGKAFVKEKLLKK